LKTSTKRIFDSEIAHNNYLIKIKMPRRNSKASINRI